MPSTHPARARWRFAAVLAVVALGAAACGDDDSAADGTTATEATTAATAAGTTAAPDGTTASTAAGTTAASDGEALDGSLRLGYFPNVTHAPALVGLVEGTFTDALGSDVDLQEFNFNSGTEASEALLSDAIDMTFIGPNPAINAFAQTKGEAIRIISGSTSGGAFLVVKPDISSPEDLLHKKLATPSLGNTQDVALRAWLKDQGYETTPEGGGDVTILPQDNAATLTAFSSDEIDGAWVPEPWASRLILEGGGKVLVDERDLWPETDGEYVTTHLMVATEYLEEHPDIVKAVLEGLLDALDAIKSDPEQAQADVIDKIEEITDQRPGEDVMTASFKNLTFTADPIAASLEGSAKDAEAVGLLEPVDLNGIYDLTLLNEVLEARGEAPIEGA